MPLSLAFASNWTQITLPMMLYGTYLGLPAVSIYLIKATPTNRRMLVFGLWSSSQSLGYIFSPIIGGFISLTISKQTVLLAAFVFYSLSILPLFLIKKLSRNTTQYLPNNTPNESSKNKRKVILLATVFCAMMFFLYLIYPLIPQFESGVYHQSVFDLGIFGTATFAGWAFLFILARKNRRYTFAS